METAENFYQHALRQNPYSLGILIEWKQEDGTQLGMGCCFYPYSLGILIEWKLSSKMGFPHLEFAYPYSLGILIEWKLPLNWGPYPPFWESLLARDIN